LKKVKKVENKRKKVYYAHSIKIYGTDREKKEIELIQEHFPGCELINPRNYEETWRNECLSGYEIMQKCLELVKMSDIVVFSALTCPDIVDIVTKDSKLALAFSHVYNLCENDSNRYVGRGVFEEVCYAEELHKKVFFIDGTRLSQNYSVDTYDGFDWTFRYGIVIKLTLLQIISYRMRCFLHSVRKKLVDFFRRI